MFVSVNTSVVLEVSLMAAAENVLVRLAVPVVTTRHWFVEAFDAFVAVTEVDRFVNAAGLVAQLAFVCAARFVTPLTVTVQLAVPAAIVTEEKAIVSGVPAVTTLEPAHPAPNVTVGVAEVNLRLDGRLSVKAIPERAGFVPVFVSVNTSVVLEVSLMAAAENVLVSEAVPVVTTRHWSVEAFVALAVVTEAERFVKAAGFAAQLAFVCVAAFVRPATVTVHEAVPEAMAMPVRPESTRVPPL